MNRDQVQIAFSLVALMALVVAFGFVLSSLVIALVIAGVLALVLRHPHRLLVERVGMGRGLATAVVVVGSMLLLGALAAFFGGRVVREVEQGVGFVRDNWNLILEYVRALPGAEQLIERFSLEERLQEFIGNAAGLLLGWTQTAVTGLAGSAFRAIIILYTVIYLLLEGPKFAGVMRNMVPLPEASMDAVLSETSRTLDATVLGTFVIAGLEGVFGALVFWTFGLPSPLLWGMVMMLLSALPVIGINVVLVPAGVVVILLGGVGRGVLIIALAVAGTLVTQNIIRPRLVGQSAGLHPVVVLLSTLGGLAWLGLVGFFVGPIIATLLLIMWRQIVQHAPHKQPQ
jgi:predicted PurR-regulated permease PerM